MDKEMENGHERAKYLHSKIKNTFARNQTTIAVGITNDDISIIGTSDNRMRKEVLDELTDADIVAASTPGNHAEEDVIEEADKRQMQLKTVDASRPICLDCEDLIKSREITTNTPFSGKQSKNRSNSQ